MMDSFYNFNYVVARFRLHIFLEIRKPELYWCIDPALILVAIFNISFHKEETVYISAAFCEYIYCENPG